MIEKVRNTIEKYNMIPPKSTVTVCLSGGADSVALLYALIELNKIYRMKIQAVHVNHCLRGTESDNDEIFCRELCRKLNITFYSKRIDVISYMKKYGKSCEESARILRYNVFEEFSGNALIATAHTLSDNAETVINNLARGTGLKGLSGIPPVRDNIIRPLIMITRDEIENYLVSKSQDFVTDSTNLTDNYTRNKIRHHIIPELQKINPSFLKTVSSGISALQTDNSFISEICRETYEKCFVPPNALENLGKYHKAVRSRCIAEFLCRNNLSYSYDRISAIDELIFKDGKINIAENVYIISKKGIIFIEHISQKINKQFRFPLEYGINIFADGKYCIAKKVNAENYRGSEGYTVDLDKIKGNIFIRSRKYGDKIKLSGKNFTSSVKKTLINLKIPAEERSELCFLEDDEGLIFAEKMGIASRVMPDADTCKLLLINIICNRK